MSNTEQPSLLSQYPLEYAQHTSRDFLRKLGVHRHFRRQRQAARDDRAEAAAITRSQAFIQRKRAEKRG